MLGMIGDHRQAAAPVETYLSTPPPLSAFVGFVTLTLTNIEITHAVYRSGIRLRFHLDSAVLVFSLGGGDAAPASISLTRPTPTIRADAAPRPWGLICSDGPIRVAAGFRLTASRRSCLKKGLSVSAICRTLLSSLISVLPLAGCPHPRRNRGELQQGAARRGLLAQVMEQARDLHTWMLTPDGRFRHANEAFCHGRRRSHERSRPSIRSKLMSTKPLSGRRDPTPGARGGGWRARDAHSQRRHRRFRRGGGRAVLDAPRAATHIVSVEQDISEERRLKEQLIRSERLSLSDISRRRSRTRSTIPSRP